MSDVNTNDITDTIETYDASDANGAFDANDAFDQATMFPKLKLMRCLEIDVGVNIFFADVQKLTLATAVQKLTLATDVCQC